MALTKEAQEARRAYKREWNRRNRDKVKAAQERYWERIAAQAGEQQGEAQQEEQAEE